MKPVKKTAPTTAKSVAADSKKATSKKRKEDPIAIETPDRVMGQPMHDISSIIESESGAPMPSRREPSHVKNERKQTGATKASKAKASPGTAKK